MSPLFIDLKVKNFKFRKSYIFEINEVSVVIATLEVNDNSCEHWNNNENYNENYHKKYRR